MENKESFKEFFVSKRVLDDVLRVCRRTLFVATGLTVAFVLVSIAFLVVAFSLSSKRTILTVITPSGYPVLALGLPDYTTETEIQTFVKEAMSKIFTFSYDTFLSQEKKKEWFQKISPFFTKEYFPRFIQGLEVSGFFKEAVKRRVAVFAEVEPPVKVALLDRKGRRFRVVFQLIRLEQTSAGTVKRLIKYEVILKRGARTLYNPWGLHIDLMREISSQVIQKTVRQKM